MSGASAHRSLLWMAIAIIAAIPTSPAAGDPGPPTPAEPPYLFDSGAPSASPFDLCGSCYAWSSTYSQGASNHDLTARHVTVPAGSFAYALRLWWVYGAEGPYDHFRNHGGTAADFSRISLDLYSAGTAGPEQLIANLEGSWTLLNPSTGYREYTLDEPFFFADSIYYVSIRAETTAPDYNAVVLWLACAPHDEPVDYEIAQNGVWSTGGWDAYTTDNRPFNPCPRDMDFGLQVLGFDSPDAVQPYVLDPCLNEECAYVAFAYHRLDPTPLRGFSVRFRLSDNLRMCPAPDSVIEGTYLSGFAPGRTHFQVAYDGGGIYTADGVILGDPCGATGPGFLFAIRVAADPLAPDGPGGVEVLSVIARDCENQPIPGLVGDPAVLVVDREDPASIADLSATQVLAGNNPPPPEPPIEVTGISVSFTLPPDVAAVELYRAPFGNYPEYDDPPVPGSEPPVPSYPPPFPWTRVQGEISSPFVDRPPQRDFWYYAAFVRDACGNISAVSNRTGGTLNYHLGDVSRGTPPLCTGDNEVSVEDLSLLGEHYGTAEGDPLYLACLDVGPTTTGAEGGRPLTDNSIDFEDLILFAINFHSVSLAGDGPDDAVARATLAPIESASDIEAGPIERDPSMELVPLTATRSAPAGEIRFALRLQDPERLVKGAHVRIEPNGLEWTGFAAGGLVDAVGAFLQVYGRDGGLVVDAAALGRGSVLGGSGDVAVLALRLPAHAGRAVPRLASVDLRGTGNRRIAGSERDGTAERASEAGRDVVRPNGSGERARIVPDAPPDDPQSLRMAVRPNPSGPEAELRLRLPETGPVTLVVYDVAGRRVRELLEGSLPAGEHAFRWDGRDDHGRHAGAGIFLAVLQAGENRRTVKIYRFR